MDGSLLSVVLDIIVLAGLGGTIFYCVRLSRALNNFRQYRQEFNTLVGELSRNIERASGAIVDLKIASSEAGEDLQKIVGKARALCDELEMMNDMGNSLANRLERLSEVGRAATVQKPDIYAAEDSSDYGRNGTAYNKPERVETKNKKQPKKNDAQDKGLKTALDDAPSFFIQDREFDDDSFHDDDHDFDSGDIGVADDEFESQAERELYQALLKNNKTKAL